MITVSGISDVLKKDIAPVIQKQFHTRKLLLEKLKQNAGVRQVGSEFYVSMDVSPHSGVVATQENASLFTGGKVKRAQSKTTPKTTVGVFRLTYETLQATRNDKFALVKELRSEAESLKETLQKDVNRQYFGYGNGQVALANGAGTATKTLVVDTPGTDYLFEGQSIIVGSNSATTIASVDSETQVTLATALTWNDNDVITKADGDGNAADEMMGLDGIVDDGTKVSTFQNIDRSSNPFWNSYVEDTSASLTIAQMRTAFRSAEKYGDVDLIMTTPTLADAYSDLLTNSNANIRLAPKIITLSGGYVGLEFAVGKQGVGVFADYDCGEGSMYFLSTNKLTQGSFGDMEWLDQDGKGGLLTRIAGTKDYEAVLVSSGNLVSLSSRAHAALKNKTA